MDGGVTAGAGADGGAPIRKRSRGNRRLRTAAAIAWGRVGPTGNRRARLYRYLADRSPARRRASIAILRVLGGLFVLGSAWGIWAVVEDSRWAIRSAGWPVGRGVILAGSVEGQRGRYYTTYRILLSYRYKVGDRYFDGSRVNFEGQNDTYYLRSEATARLLDYPVGTPVAVRYDPADPRRCCLEAGLRPEYVCSTIVFFILMATIGFGALIKPAWFEKVTRTK